MRGRRRMRRLPLPPPDVQRARINEKIRVPQVRLIDEEGQQVGVVATDEARAMAVRAELDLVEVAAEARPPVCRIMNYGKFLFEQQKKERQTKKRQAQQDVKEVRLRPGTGQGDMDIKSKHAREFLLLGHKVGIQLLFRGREQAHPELGVEKIKEFAATLADIAKIEQMPRKEGRRMNSLLAPLPEVARAAAKVREERGIKDDSPDDQDLDDDDLEDDDDLDDDDNLDDEDDDDEDDDDAKD